MWAFDSNERPNARAARESESHARTPCLSVHRAPLCIPCMLPLVGVAEAIGAGVHAIFPHTIGIIAGFFGFSAVAVGIHEANSSTPEGAANVGGAGLGFMDEQRLREKEAREDAEMAQDRQKAAAKLAAGPGLLDPISKKVHGSIMDVPNAIMGAVTR